MISEMCVCWGGGDAEGNKIQPQSVIILPYIHYIIYILKEMKTITYGSMSSSVYRAVVHNLKYSPTTQLLMATYIPHHIIRTQFT